MQKSIITSIIAIALLLVAIVAFLSSRPSTPSEVRIGVALPIADVPVVAEGIRRAFELAKQLNPSPSDTPQVAWQYFELGSIGQGLEEWDFLGTQRSNTAFVAMWGARNSDAARRLIPLSSELGIAVVSSYATWPGLTKPGFGLGEPAIYYPSGQRTFFRVVPADDVQGRYAAQWVAAKGWKRILVVHDETTYSAGLAGIFEADAQDNGLEIVQTQRYSSTTLSPADARRMAEAMADERLDLIYMPIFWYENPRSSLLFEAYRRSFPDVPVLLSDSSFIGVNPQTDLPAGTWYATTIASSFSDFPAARAFVQAYTEAYGEAPAEYLLPAFEAAQVLLQATFRAASPSREGILAYLHELRSFAGVYGEWGFDVNGDTTVQNIRIKQFSQNQWMDEDIGPN